MPCLSEEQSRHHSADEPRLEIKHQYANTRLRRSLFSEHFVEAVLLLDLRHTGVGQYLA